MTGFIFGLFVLPGYALSSFETVTAYPFYVLQLMLFSVFIAFVMNQTRGNVLFFVFCFWLVASGSKLQFYNGSADFRNRIFSYHCYRNVPLLSTC